MIPHRVVSGIRLQKFQREIDFQLINRTNVIIRNHNSSHVSTTNDKVQGKLFTLRKCETFQMLDILAKIVERGTQYMVGTYIIFTMSEN